MMLGPKLLKKWRGKKSQEDAAKLLDVSQSTVCDWEKGKKCPRVDQALRIARMTEGAVPIESWATSRSGEHPAVVVRSTGTGSR